VIGGKQTLPLQEEWPRQKSGMRDVFKTVNARRKDDDGKWWVAAWLRDGYMWATVIASAAAELDAAQETAAAKTAALTAVLAVKSVEPTCPVRAALRTWEARTGLAKKQVSALLRCDAGSLNDARRLTTRRGRDSVGDRNEMRLMRCHATAYHAGGHAVS